tara:strand:- start:5157 stop:5471 length:315 start_codon:yes stop_codon:yes gene_type:complete
MHKIGEAVEALKEGKRVRRKSWSEDRKFIFQQVPAQILAPIIPVMQSLPQTVKDYFVKNFETPEEQIDAVYYGDQIAEVGLSHYTKGYAPSPADILAEDWEILD